MTTNYPVEDKFGNTLELNDVVFFASKNEVHIGTITKIAEDWHHHGYGCCYKKLTILEHTENRKFTINIPQTTVKLSSYISNTLKQ